MPVPHSEAAVTIGCRIRDRRRRLGISLEDLGEIANISWTTIGKIERGVQSPSVETIIRISTALDVDPGVFLNGVTADQYGERERQVSARELVSVRSRRAR
ncbi:helix-turn-helix domain-containing protein [Leucobacter luti]|uniref:helix-turn-helix domain-containing protein n=1 Tax=Leucobacter luti TaxID=340320 RepID=UPI003D042D96